MVTALDRMGLTEVLIVGFTVGGVLMILWYTNKKLNEYTPLKTLDYHVHEVKSLQRYFVPKKRMEMDSRGFTDISSAAGTHPKSGVWGGHKNHQVNADQTPGVSGHLFSRSTKTFHPWAHLQKESQRKQAFSHIYTSRLHAT